MFGKNIRAPRFYAGLILIGYCNNSLISLGKTKVDSSVSVPYNLSSNDFSLPASTRVESITTDAVGFIPFTGTGTVVTSQLNVTASGLSLIVEYAFSDGFAVHP